MPRAHERIPITEIKGLFKRQEYTIPPLGYSGTCHDMMFKLPGNISFGGKAFTRAPYQDYPLAFPTNVVTDGGPVRFHKYRRITDTQDHWIILSAAGKFYDTGKIIPNNPILTITDPIPPDFSLITIGNRCIFSPHDRNTGTDGEFTYIYERDVFTTARKLAGAKPVGVFTVAVSATNGNTEPGLHIIAVAYEFNTGFITKPALYQQLTAPAGVRKAIDLTAIPLGPAGVVARRILMTRNVTNFDGNNAHPELFFALKIADNTTGLLLNAISMFDTQLIQSADYLKDNLEEVPAMLCFSYFEKSLVCSGAANEKSVVRVSKGGDYESFNATDGFVECAPFEGDGVRNLRAARGSLYMFKRKRTFVTRNNGESPSSWIVDLVDSGLGAEVFSIAEMDDSSIVGSINNAFLVANLSGFWLFDNGFVDLLSWPVQQLWESTYTELWINSINTVIVVYEAQLKIGVIFKPHVTDILNWELFFYDISNGISKESIKWATWSRTDNVSAVFAGMHLGSTINGPYGAPFDSELVVAADEFASFRVIRFSNHIYAPLPTNSDKHRNPSISFTLEADDLSIHQIGGAKFEFGGDSTGMLLNSIEIAANAGYKHIPLNIQGRVVGFVISAKPGATTQDPTYFHINKVVIFDKIIWDDIPK